MASTCGIADVDRFLPACGLTFIRSPATENPCWSDQSGLVTGRLFRCLRLVRVGFRGFRVCAGGEFLSLISTRHRRTQCLHTFRVRHAGATRISLQGTYPVRVILIPSKFLNAFVLTYSTSGVLSVNNFAMNRSMAFLDRTHLNSFTSSAPGPSSETHPETSDLNRPNHRARR